MDFGKIKKLVKQNGDKIIVFENGEPEVVVMAFHEYEKLMKGAPEIISVSPVQQTFVPLPAFPPVEAFPEGERFSDVHSMDSFEEERRENARPLPPRAEEAASFSGLPLRLEDVRLEDLPIEGYERGVDVFP